jgi:hypothetical protein
MVRLGIAEETHDGSNADVGLLPNSRGDRLFTAH